MCRQFPLRWSVGLGEFFFFFSTWCVIFFCSSSILYYTICILCHCYCTYIMGIHVYPTCMYCFFIGWSLSAVKQALSHLRWQRDRLDHLHASATSLHGPDTLTPHQKIISMIVDLVSLVFSQKEGKGKLDDSADSRDTPSTDLMNRVILIRQLMGQRRRAMVSFTHSLCITIYVQLFVNKLFSTIVCYKMLFMIHFNRLVPQYIII